MTRGRIIAVVVLLIVSIIALVQFAPSHRYTATVAVQLTPYTNALVAPSFVSNVMTFSPDIKRVNVLRRPLTIVRSSPTNFVTVFIRTEADTPEAALSSANLAATNVCLYTRTNYGSQASIPATAKARPITFLKDTVGRLITTVVNHH